MGYIKVRVCDICSRSPNGSSPDTLYPGESPHNTVCKIHDICNDCMRSKRVKEQGCIACIKENQKKGKIRASINIEFDLSAYGIPEAFNSNHPQFKDIVSDLITSMIDGEADWPSRDEMNITIF